MWITDREVGSLVYLVFATSKVICEDLGSNTQIIVLNWKSLLLFQIQTFVKRMRGNMSLSRFLIIYVFFEPQLKKLINIWVNDIDPVYLFVFIIRKKVDTIGPKQLKPGVALEAATSRVIAEVY